MAEQLIADYLRRTGPQPWTWGRVDCATWAAGLVAAVAGIDPAVAYRGRYSTRFEARQMILRAGGLRALVARQMAGFPVMGSGGSGVAVAAIRGQAVCGVMLSGRLILKSDRGLVWPGAWELLEGWSLCRKS